MSALTSKDIADWHRNEAKKHQELANFHRKTAEAIIFSDPHVEKSKGSREILKPIVAKENLTLEEFEKDLAEKGGRVNHLAARLGVGEDVIWDLLKDPACRYEVGERGFIYEKKP
jgi:hypothetical protein